MNNPMKWLVGIVFCFATMIPLAYGISFGASFGDCHGNSATAFATVLGAPDGFHHDISGEPGVASVGIHLIVPYADYIKAGATATDNHQNKASVGIELTNALDTVYYNHADVMDHPMASQMLFGTTYFTPLKADKMTTTALAADENGNRATASTTVTNAATPYWEDMAAADPSHGIRVMALDGGALSGDTLNSKSTVIDENQNKVTSSTVINSQFTTDLLQEAVLTTALYTDYPNEQYAFQKLTDVDGANIKLSSSATNENGKTKRSSPLPITTDGSGLISYGLLDSGVPSAFSGLYDGDGSDLPFPILI